MDPHACDVLLAAYFKKLEHDGVVHIKILEAPHVLPMRRSDKTGTVDLSSRDRENARAWFLYDEHDPTNTEPMMMESTTQYYYGLDDSFELVRQYFKEIYESSQMQEKHPTHPTNVLASVLGFSQGATFVHILLSHPEFQSQIHSAIFMSGFRSQHAEFSSTDSSIPSLHFIGSKDTRVLPQRSEALASCFLRPQIHRHAKGHVIPQTQAEIAVLLDFLNQT